MRSIVLVYKKKDKLWFLNIEDAKNRDAIIKKHGWKHISTIDPSIILSNINDICQEKLSCNEKIKNISELLELKQEPIHIILSPRE